MIPDNAINPPPIAAPGPSITPAKLGTSKFEIIPREYAGNAVRFLQIPQLSDAKLSALQAVIFGLAFNAGHSDESGNGKHVITILEYRALLTDIELMCLGIKTWSPELRCRCLASFTKARLAKKQGGKIELSMTKLWWRLPNAILVRQDLTIEAKVTWAAMAFLSNGSRRPGVVPMLATVAAELGRREEGKKTPKRTLTDHIARFKKMGLVKSSAGDNHMVPVPELSQFDTMIITGDRYDAATQWTKLNAAPRTIIEKRNAILLAHHPQFRRLSEEMDLQRYTIKDQKAYLAALQHWHECVWRVLDQIEGLLTEVRDAADWLILGLDRQGVIRLSEDVPRRLNHQAAFDQMNDHQRYHKKIDESVSAARLDMVQILYNGKVPRR